MKAAVLWLKGHDPLKNEKNHKNKRRNPKSKCGRGRSGPGVPGPASKTKRQGPHRAGKGGFRRRLAEHLRSRISPESSHRREVQGWHPVPAKLKGAHKETQNKLDRWFQEAEQMKKNATTLENRQIVLDQWQLDAVQALQLGFNVVVDAPTTAGKTLVVDTFISKEISKPGFRACYTCPVKSLSNDKLKEFRAKYGKDAVGIATGDSKENLDAPLVIATLETYRNSLLGVDPDLGRKLVIFDEYHFIQDDDRGSAWEEAMILTPPDCQMLLLSASLSNAREFSDWLEYLSGRATELIQVGQRPVPLADMVWHQGRWYLVETLPAPLTEKKKPTLPEPVPLRELAPRLRALEEMSLTPCIVYAGKRLSCELIAQALLHTLEPLDSAKAGEIGSRLMEADRELRVLSFLQPSLRRMIQTYGIAYHHSGLAPQIRVAIEGLVKDGLIRFCVATMGLSLGINFSVRSTVICDAVRPGSQGFTSYSPSEVLQMTGRAGRRGRDPVGFSCWLGSDFMAMFGKAKREPGNSRLKNDPTTFLGLISQGFSPGRVEQFYRKSFRYFNLNNSSTPMSLIRRDRLRKELKRAELPCRSPAAEFTAWKNLQNAACYDCNALKECHRVLKRWRFNPLSQLHFHLHQIGALNADESLTPYGELARYFPQSGGLLIASMIDLGEISYENILSAAQLMGALSLACYKSPAHLDTGYRLPFSPGKVRKELEAFYPPEDFPKLYDQQGRGYRRKSIGFREFNPLGGLIIKKWSETSCTWRTLTKEVCTDQFGAGDVTGLIYRTSSWLQSVSQAPCAELSQSAWELRDILLREPLQVAT